MCIGFLHVKERHMEKEARITAENRSTYLFPILVKMGMAITLFKGNEFGTINCL